MLAALSENHSAQYPMTKMAFQTDGGIFWGDMPAVGHGAKLFFKPVYGKLLPLWFDAQPAVKQHFLTAAIADVGCVCGYSTCPWANSSPKQRSRASTSTSSRSSRPVAGPPKLASQTRASSLPTPSNTSSANQANSTPSPPSTATTTWGTPPGSPRASTKVFSREDCGCSSSPFPATAMRPPTSWQHPRQRCTRASAHTSARHVGRLERVSRGWGPARERSGTANCSKTLGLPSKIWVLKWKAPLHLQYRQWVPFSAGYQEVDES
mmetsp:Transcript_12354/g.31180  ORF Transcript_12354/g.31180 Transcript_12354/m.31180 type:complete len:265 (-) Transcript_12354:258-1052(-)